MRGFTLIELLIVLAILAILALLVAPVAQTSIQRARENELRLALREIRNAIDAYKRASDEGRIHRSPEDTGYPHSLTELVEGVEDQRNPKHSKIYFLRQIPRDPMSADPAGDAEAIWGKRSYASEPNEPQEGADVFDVYTPATGTGLNGVPYRQW
jgi:general secretion pathway protein G